MMRPHLVAYGTAFALVVAGGFAWSTGYAAPGAAIIALGAGIAIFVMIRTRTREDERFAESPLIEDVSDARRQELIRGTSMHLRDMKYRYSLRFDRTERRPFTAEINTVTLGFLPVVILDNVSDKQGYGYVAFPYDGSRWRGPGLPCGGSPEQAIEHAARCVAPLSDEAEDDEPEDDER